MVFELRLLWRSARVRLQCLLLTQIQKSIAAGTIAGAGPSERFRMQRNVAKAISPLKRVLANRQVNI